MAARIGAPRAAHVDIHHVCRRIARPHLARRQAAIRHTDRLIRDVKSCLELCRQRRKPIVPIFTRRNAQLTFDAAGLVGFRLRNIFNGRRRFAARHSFIKCGSPRSPLSRRCICPHLVNRRRARLQRLSHSASRPGRRRIRRPRLEHITRQFLANLCRLMEQRTNQGFARNVSGATTASRSDAATKPSASNHVQQSRFARRRNLTSRLEKLFWRRTQDLPNHLGTRPHRHKIGCKLSSVNGARLPHRSRLFGKPPPGRIDRGLNLFTDRGACRRAGQSARRASGKRARTTRRAQRACARCSQRCAHKTERGARRIIECRLNAGLRCALLRHFDDLALVVHPVFLWIDTNVEEDLLFIFRCYRHIVYS